MRYEKIGKLLGVEIPHDEITGILRKLSLEIQQVTQETFVVTAPSFRPDLTIGADILEEVARLYGYGKIPTTMPITDISSTGRVLDRRIAKTKEAMRKEGLNETINYSFMNENYLDVLKIPEGDSRRKTVRIKNPLRAEDAVLRTMLVPSLIENFLYNFNRGTKDIRLFEIARVFEDTGDKLPKETLKLCGISFAEQKPNLWKESSPDFYQLKGAMEALFHTLRAPEPEFKKPTEESFLHPGKSADIYLKGKKAGFIGELSPDILENLDVKTKTSLNLCALDMDVLLSSAWESVTYSSIPRYPAIERDISLVVDEAVQAADIAALIRSYPGEFIEEVSVFDTFTGKNIPAGKKSLAFNMRYRSPERTLTDEEVEKIHEGIVKHVTEKTGGEIRA
jgi:phenylalanyl-tRNA synthetase beta chain